MAGLAASLVAGLPWRAQREPAGRLLVDRRQACPGRRGSGMVVWHLEHLRSWPPSCPSPERPRSFCSLFSARSRRRGPGARRHHGRLDDRRAGDGGWFRRTERRPSEGAQPLNARPAALHLLRGMGHASAVVVPWSDGRMRMLRRAHGRGDARARARLSWIDLRCSLARRGAPAQSTSRGWPSAPRSSLRSRPVCSDRGGSHVQPGRAGLLPGLLVLPLASSRRCPSSPRGDPYRADRDRGSSWARELGTGSTARPRARHSSSTRARSTGTTTGTRRTGIAESPACSPSRRTGARCPAQSRRGGRDGSIRSQSGAAVRSPGLVTSNSITVAGTARARLVRSGADHPARSLGRGAAAPAPLPHPGSRARANVNRSIRDRRLRLPAERPPRAAPRVHSPCEVRYTGSASRWRRAWSRAGDGHRSGSLAPRSGRQPVRGALRADSMVESD